MTRSGIICVLSVLITFVAATASAQGWVTAPPLYGVQTINTGFMPDPVEVAVVAGGADDPIATLGAVAPCNGMITSAQPDVRLNFTAGTLPLYLFTASTGDTTLVVNAPDGSWHCNDDFNGLDPMVQFAPAQTGQYDIWVGVWNSTTTVNATLYISEVQTAPTAVAATAIACGQNAQTLLGEPGTIHRVTCPAGCPGGTIWGTGIYSDDSAMCNAAVHAGVIPMGAGGTFNVTIAPGQPAYPPSTMYGVTSANWGSWSRSFTVSP